MARSGSHLVRISILIGGKRLFDTQFSEVTLQQTIGWHHDFEIRMSPESSQGKLVDKVKEWIGMPVQIGFDMESDEKVVLSPIPKDRFIGIITSVGLARNNGGLKELVVRGHSPTITADDGSNVRSFTDMGLAEVVDEVLSDYNNAFAEPPSVEPKIFTGTIPYVVQYKESNFSFVSRLANRYGEWFYYDGLKLHFGKPEDEDPIKLDFDQKGLTDFDLSVKTSPMGPLLKGYDYLKHEQMYNSVIVYSVSDELAKEAYNLSSEKVFPIAANNSSVVNMAVDQDELDNFALRKEEVSVDEMVVLNGTGMNPNLKIGAKIKVEISDGLKTENYGEYIIVQLNHKIKQGGDYSNDFQAIPAGVGKTPPLSIIPNPPFCETQLAKVTDVDDEKSLGRVQVKFLWQESTEEKSPWIRVASPYTGKDKGFYIIPEKDDQVLVAFENNNPDKPYVLSGMYNADAKPEWFDAKNRYKGFKSKEQNEWKFDDKEKSITINAPNSIMLSAGKEITIKTGGKSGSKIKIESGEGTITVVAKTINIGDSQKTTTVNVNAKTTIMIDSSDAATLKGAKTATVEGASTGSTVKGAKVDVNTTGPVTIKGATVKLN